ncbi:cytochrome c family protein [Brevundimonas sp. S30B]|uniref:c-type cytochrome n=1 Tax=unclassified Brevundimonas TaxID=2622653 RepID=UPI001071B270|nr:MULTISPECIES: cytochrome c family protein [unclassified Brevundimonas]QBX36956.1 cytochrome c family protein [Brevundimonas sp. MF30-B]TFW04249.1 cytochrome c family protein [Brevundimonas sp. S30B]
MRSIRPFAPLLAVVALAGCGQGGEPAAPKAPARPALTDAQREALLASLPAPYNAGDMENGRRAFARCRSCHTITDGGPNMTGPNLWGVFGRGAGSHPGYNYSNALREADFAWDAQRLDDWLANPRTFLPGNKMTFPGLPDASDRRDVIAWLKVETGYGQAAPTAHAAP